MFESSPWLSGDSELLSLKIKEDENYLMRSRDVAEDIFLNKLDISIFVECLSGVLTDTNPEHRMRGTLFFSQVLSYLPHDFLKEEQLRFISNFYIDRLKDNHRVIPPVIEGLLSIIKMQNLPRDAPCKILHGLNQNVPCQQQMRTDRSVIYNIFKALLQSFEEELKAIGPDCVYTVISAMDGERDPRNLMFLFTFLPDFLATIPLGHLAEEMFDVIACYFPVDFNTSQDDPNAITRDDLAEKLSVCLCATPVFGKFTLPLLLEKLDSDLKLAKLDSLKLLSQSYQIFSVEDYEAHLPTIWNLLKKELKNKSDEEITQASHQSFAALINKLSSLQDITKFEVFLKQIVDSMKILLADAKTKPLIQQPLHILLTAAKASEKSCIYITEHAVPLLILHHHLNLSKHLQITSLEWFVDMFNVSELWNVLHQNKSKFMEIPKMCFTGLEEDDEELKIACFKTLSSITDIIDTNDFPVVCNIIDKHLFKSVSIQLKEASKKCLLTLAKKEPEKFKCFVSTKLNFETLSMNAEELAINLDVLCSLVSVHSYTDKIVEKILMVLKSSNDETVHILLLAICKNFKNEELFKCDQIAQIQKKYDLIKHILECFDRNFEKCAEFLNVYSELIVIIMRVMSGVAQSDVLSIYVPKYLKALDADSSYVVILEALLNSTKLETCLNNTDVLMSSVTDLAFDRNPMVHNKCCAIIGNLFNKYISNDEIQLQYQNIKHILCKKLDVDNVELITMNSIDLCRWMCKSLFLNSHPDASYWLEAMIKLLCIEKWSLEVAKMFKMLVSDTQDALNSYCFCKTNVFYQQKLYHLFTKFTTDMKASLSTDYNRQSYMLAYVHIIQSLPNTVVKMEASQITSVLIESLSFSESELLAASLSTLAFLIQDKDPSVLSSLQSLIPKCVKLALLKGSMHVRIASLECLYNIANSYSTFSILPYKEDLIYQLVPTLDDPKRLVRVAAVKASTRWYLVGAPGEDNLKS